MSQAPINPELHDLPADWKWVQLSDICDPLNGRGFKKTEWRDKGLPIIRIQNLKDPNAAFNYFDGDLGDNHKVESGDLLFAWSGTPGTSFGAHIWRGDSAALNQHIFNVKFDSKEIDPKYFCYALNQNVTRYVEQAQGGVGLAHITKGKFLESSIPLAPRDQQDRIVAEIEKQFSRLDEAVASLKRVKANLKRYKAAVLKAAVEGKLTEEWRKQNPDVEPASKLLERILAERRTKWEEAELAKMKAKGKEPKNDKWKEKYKEPVQAALEKNSVLPEGWCLSTIERVSLLVTDGDHNPPKRVAVGVPHLTARNVMNGRLNEDKCTFITPKDFKKVCKRYEPMAGDVIVTCVGSIGRTAIVPEGYYFSADRNLAVVRLASKGIESKYLQLYIDSPGSQSRIRSASGSTAQPHIYLADLRSFPIAVPSCGERIEIIKEVEQKLSVVTVLESELSSEIKRSDRLRQSVLAALFRGDADKARY